MSIHAQPKKNPLLGNTSDNEIFKGYHWSWPHIKKTGKLDLLIFTDYDYGESLVDRMQLGHLKE